MYHDHDMLQNVIFEWKVDDAYISRPNTSAMSTKPCHIPLKRYKRHNTLNVVDAELTVSTAVGDDS